MDLDTVILPGAQSLMTAMLTDAWTSVRAAFARRWGRDAEHGTELERRLDDARERALVLAGQEDDDDREGRLQAFWAGYLAGLLAERPELAGALQELIAGLRPADGVRNSNTGTVRGHLVQARDVSGGIEF